MKDVAPLARLSTPAPRSSKIGEINGWAAKAFKVHLVLLPLVLGGILALQVFVVQSIHGLDKQGAVVQTRMDAFEKAGPRYTPAQAAVDNSAWSETTIRKTNEELAEKLAPIERRLERIESKVDAL